MILRVLINLIMLVNLYSCNSEVSIDLVSNIKDEGTQAVGTKVIDDDSSPVTASIIVADGYRNIESVFNLSYVDADLDLAHSCSVTSLVNVVESTNCSCTSGICKVGLTGITGYTGSVSFSFSISTKDKVSNLSSVSYELNSIGASDTDEWVRVPQNAGGYNLDEFYVMKFEAKAWNDLNANNTVDALEVDSSGVSVNTATHSPISSAKEQPWRNIDANEAAAECESLGENYHLISNQEWMAISRDIETQGQNWVSGTVGLDCLKTGNSADTSCGYNALTSPDSGVSRDARAELILSNE